jgi:hypothetical protein
MFKKGKVLIKSFMIKTNTTNKMKIKCNFKKLSQDNILVPKEAHCKKGKNKFKNKISSNQSLAIMKKMLI